MEANFRHALYCIETTSPIHKLRSNKDKLKQRAKGSLISIRKILNVVLGHKLEMYLPGWCALWKQGAVYHPRLMSSDLPLQE